MRQTRLAELNMFAQKFIALFRDSDMRPEDECHYLYELAMYATGETDEEPEPLEED